jgi:hypothetical protein
MYETLLRSHDVAQVPVLQSISEVEDKLKKGEEIREIKRLKQIAAGQRSRENPHGEKRKRDEDMDDQEELPPVTKAEDSGSGKRLKTDDEMDDGTVTRAIQDGDVSRSLDESSTHIVHAATTNPAYPAKFSVSKATAEVRGHTSYLTFATLLPPMPPGPPADAPPQGLLSSLTLQIATHGTIVIRDHVEHYVCIHRINAGHTATLRPLLGMHALAPSQPGAQSESSNAGGEDFWLAEVGGYVLFASIGPDPYPPRDPSLDHRTSASSHLAVQLGLQLWLSSRSNYALTGLYSA